MDRYHALLKSQRGKPYYVPSKAQLLAYDDAFYCEPAEETNQMREFIATRLQLPDWKKAEVFDELVFGIRCADADFPQVQERLTAMGVHFPRRKDFQTFIERYQAGLPNLHRTISGFPQYHQDAEQPWLYPQ